MKTAKDVCLEIKAVKEKERLKDLDSLFQLLIRNNGKVDLAPMDCQYFRGAFNNQELLKSSGFKVEVYEETWTSRFLFWKTEHSQPRIKVTACCGEEK